MNKIKIKDLPEGMIIWENDTILGITQATLPLEYYDCYCTKIIGNDFDYKIVKEQQANENKYV